MFKHLIAQVPVVLAIVFVSPAVAQQPPGTSVGTLTCKMAPSIGLIFGSRQRMACRFAPSGPQPHEAYVGVMGTIGLDVGITAGGVMAWGVFAHTAGPTRGALAGTYVGASGAIGVGVGVGANLLFGGTGRSIALQPLSVELGETSTGVQIAADALKDAVIACKAEISGVCGKILPGQGRIAACLLSNKSTASAGCVDAIKKIESMAAE